MSRTPPPFDLRELVDAVRTFDTLTARQWVTDAAACGFRWDRVPQPDGFDNFDLALAAGLVELMAERAGVTPPAWTSRAPVVSPPVSLLGPKWSKPLTLQRLERDTPDALRRRGFRAPEAFLTVA